ncbi:MAG: YfhO family protein, partial [Clostridiaceae bacterium]|nr:YfhO family protein [Clostridiaceae bacterium]
MEKLPRGAFVLKRDKTPFWNNSSLAWIAFLIPFVIMALAYGAIQVFPFGQRHMLTVDLYHQYAPFFALFRDKLLSGGSLFYSMAGGLGTNFYALFAYYLASPLNLLLLIFPPAYLTEAIMLITLIKIGLAGLTFYLY